MSVKREIEECEQMQDNLESEYTLVDNDCHDYEQMVAGLENPVQEIERAELILNIKKNKPMLTNLINRL